ncbi:MAG: thioredoxin-dependent thiol peroxidase [Candidatus Pacebacteria bacterium]|nr:thioredoxin-dependent thiol peroxidase [Candidatus Paceibacterota bacterium]
MLEINSPAPEFTLLDQDEKHNTLSEYRGQYVLIYFYPKDDTPGCTQQACILRDIYDEFEKIQVKVIGISADSPKSHKKFAEKYQLPFTLLSDTDRTTLTAFGALKEKSMFGKSFLGIIRSSFLINPEGVIIKVYPKVDPATHADIILADLDSLMHA